MEIRGSKIEPAVAASLNDALQAKMANSDLVMVSWMAASWCHLGDVRSDGLPYITHPARVASRVLRWAPNAPESYVAAALMHDAVEDHPKEILSMLGTLPDSNESEGLMRERIENRVTDNSARGSLIDVLNIVLHVSNPVMPRSASREERNISYWSHLSNHVVNNPAALLIKCSDFVDNAGSLSQMRDTKRASRMATKYAHAGRILLAGMESTDLTVYGRSFNASAVRSAVEQSVETAESMK